MANQTLKPFSGELDPIDSASGLKPFTGTLDGEKPQRTLAQAAKDTGAQLAEGVNTTLGAIPSVVAPQSRAAGFFRDNAQYWRDQQSDVLKDRIAASDRRIQEAGKDGVLPQIGAAASEYWNDPAQAARLVATNIPSMAATLGTGAVAGLAAKGVAAARGLDAANKAALAAKYGTTTAAATNAALNAGGARGEAFEDLQKTALAQGMTPEQAEQAGVSGSILPGVVGGVAGAISGKIGLEKAILGQATTGAAMRKAAGAFGAELAGEQIEELAPKVATNYQVGRIDPGRTLTDDLGRTMVETAIGSGPGAVVAGGAAGMRTGELPPSPGAGEPTTSPGAADPNAPLAPIAQAPEAPDQSEPGAPLPTSDPVTPEQRIAAAEEKLSFVQQQAQANGWDKRLIGARDEATAELDALRIKPVDIGALDIQLSSTEAPSAGEYYAPGDTTNPLTGERIPDQRPLSQQMGIDPTDGPLSKAAATAVDSGTSQHLQDAQFIGATGRDLQVRATGPGVTDDSNVIDVQGRVVDELAVGASRGINGGAQRALPPPKNLREGLERIRAQRQESANAQAAAQSAPTSALAVSTARPGAVEAAGPAPVSTTTGVTDGPQADQAQQTAPQQPQAPAAPGLTNAATTQNDGAQGQAAPGAQGAAPAPQAAVARPDGWRKSMLRAVPVAKSLGIDHKGKRLAQIVAEIDAADAQRAGVRQDGADLSSGQIDRSQPGSTAQVMRSLAQQFRDRHAVTQQDTDRTFAGVLEQFANEVEEGKRTPQSVQQAIERYRELADGPKDQVQTGKVAATHADPGQAPEVATPAIVAQSVQKAARNEDTKPSEMRKWLVGKIDEAIAVAPEAAVDFLSFDVPGDGAFKVQNSQARLQEFRKKVLASPGFKDGGQKQNTKPLEQVDSAINGSGSTVEALRNFLADGDVQGAIEFAKLKGVEFTPVPPQMKMRADGKGKVKHMPASVKSSVPSVAEGLTQVEAEQINQYLTAENAIAEQNALQSPQDGNQAYSDGQQLGADDLLAYFDQVIAGSQKGEKIVNLRFQIGEVDAGTAQEIANYIDGYDGQQRRLRVSGRTLKHIHESRPAIAREIVEQLPGMFSNPDEVLPDPKHKNKRALLVKERKAKESQSKPKSYVATVEVEIEVEVRDGFIDIVTIMTAPDRSLREARELKKNWPEGQQRTEQAVNSPHPLTAEAANPEADSPDARPAGISVPPAAPAAQPITRADVETAKKQAAAIITERIDAMTAGEVNTIARRFLPTMGVRPTVSKERNKAAVTDFTKVNPLAAADEFGATLPAEVKRALQADIEGAVADGFVEQGDAPMFSRAQAKEIRNLVTLHNLTDENLRYADSMGGIPVPSIGITKVESPFGGFGNITLIAPRGMIDPKDGVPVYDRDAWTARFPTMNFKKVKAKMADALYERMNPVRELMAGDDDGFIAQLWAQLRNASVQSPEKITSIFTRYEAGRVMYAKEVLGKTIKVPMRNVRPSMPSGHDAQLVAYWKKHGAAFKRMERDASGAEISRAPENKAFEEEVRASIRRYAEAVGEPEKADQYINTAMPDGTLGAGMRDRWIRDIETAGKKEVDRIKLGEAVNKAVKRDDPAYLRWVESLVKPLFDEPTITLRGREVAPTLDNIVDAMTVGATAGAEKSMTFSPGKVAAMLGKQFKSLDEIKAARDQVVSAKAETEGKKATDALLDGYRTHVSQFYGGKDWRGNIDTWAANDDSMEALAKAGKLPPSDASIRATLARMNFKGVDQRAVDMAREAITALRNAATDYFEAKPQRAVTLDEFKGAVVPKGTSAETLAILEKHGIAVEVHNKTEGAREKAIQKLAKRLDSQSGDVLFARDSAAPPLDSNARNVATQMLVDGLTEKWTRAPEIIVARNMQDPQVPQAVRDYDETLKSQGATGEARGFIYKGKVYLLSDELKGPQQIAEVLFHEVLGHYGLRGAFGDSLDTILQQIGTMRRRDVVAKAREYGLFDKDALGGMDKKTASVAQIWAAMSSKDRLSAAEEVLAEMAQTQPNIGFVQRAIAAIRNWLRSNVPGFKSLRLTDADIIQAYILPARGFVTRSKETGAQSLERAMMAFSRGTNEAVEPHVSAARQILESINKDPTAEYALRVIPGEYEGPIKAGDVLPVSKVWLDGEETSKSLKGTSVARIRGTGEKAVLDALTNLGAAGKNGPNGYYFGNRIVLVKGEGIGAGEDVGESIFKNAEVIGVWNKSTKGLSSIQPNESTAPDSGGAAFSRTATDQTQTMTDEQARQNGFTLKAYRGISKSNPFNDSGTTWLTTSREVAEAYAEEVMGYDDPGVLEVMVKPDGLPRHDASRLTDEQREAFGADEFGNPQSMGIYDRSDDHPLGGSRGNVTVIHAPREAVAVLRNAVPAASRAPAGDQTQTEAFKKWFGDSAVVDADGKPLRVLHGTGGDFSVFSRDRAGATTGAANAGMGFFFTDNAEVAGNYARMSREPQSIMPVYLSLQNPLRMEAKNMMEADRLLQAGLKDNNDGAIITVAMRDGGTQTVYMTRESNQVKSATGNNGSFDPANPDIRFSRTSTTGVAARMGDAIKSVTVQNVKDQAGYKKADWLGLGLQTLGRRQIVDIYGKDLPQLNAYNKLAAQMEADKNEVGAEADQLAQRWGSLKDEKALAELMHDATLAQIDPDKGYVAGDSKLQHSALSARFNRLSDEAKQVYRDARAAYEDHHSKVREAIKQRIMRSELMGERRADLLKRMDDEFFKKTKGVYFPLARFGQYVVAVKGPDGKIASVNRAETMAEAQALRASLVKAFPPSSGHEVVRPTLSKEFIASRDAVGRGFMTELYGALEGVDMGAAERMELEDTLGQLYLSSLPDLSWAKHGIHRKGTPGFSQDARRAFAQNMFHGGRYLAKLRYADLMQSEITDMQKMADDWKEVEDFDQPTAQRVVDEMQKRHESLMNPKSNPLSSALTSFGFVFFLGLSPASALVNLSQTALVAYPVMAAKWGFDKSAAALLRASKQAAMGKNDITGSLNAEERAAYDEAVRAGTIDVTMAHDLAGIAQGEDSGVMWKIRPVMRWASFMFHHAERFNRQVTFIAAYRLAKDAGSDAKTAFEQATDATYKGHFDYSSGNRARVMQGNTAKVLLLFKQYGQNMIYTLARSAQQAIKGETPEARREARRALTGLLVMHGLGAGTLGLPLVTTLLAAASMIGGDDDEPWDAKVALQNMLADAFGQKPAEVMMHGLSRLTPWDISGRVGLDRLILPDVQEGLEGQRLAESAMTAALGPVAGIGVNVLKGIQDMSNGQFARGLEGMLPAAVRNGAKAVRYANEGAQDKSGIIIKDEVNPAEVIGQALGFSPSSVRNAAEGKSAVLDFDRELTRRRGRLLTEFANARRDGDAEAVKEAQADIAKFNEKNPGRRITVPQMMASVRARQMRIDQAKDGVYLPKNRADARDAGRFAIEQ